MGRGQQSNLTHCGCEQCVYMPKLVVCKWVWYWLTAPENSSRSGHMHFPEGSPRRHQDIFMIHPLANNPPHPHPHPRHSHIDNLDSSICCCCSFSENAILLATFHQGGGGDQETSCKGLMLELWSPGWLNGCRGAQEKSVTFWVRMCGRFLEEKKKNQCDVFVSGLILPELLTEPDST